jgi:hypothetical protein
VTVVDVKTRDTIERIFDMPSEEYQSLLADQQRRKPEVVYLDSDVAKYMKHYKTILRIYNDPQKVSWLLKSLEASKESLLKQ